MIHPTKPLAVLLLIPVLLVACAPAAAQSAGETAANQTVLQNGPDDVELVLDDDAAVKSYSYSDGTFTLSIWSDEYKTVTVAASPEKGSQTGSASFKTVAVKKSAVTKVKIESPTAVSLWTEDSKNAGKWHYVTKPNDFLVTGPWSGSDVRDAGIGGALGVVLTVLYTAVSAKVSGGQRGEQVA